MTPRSKSSKPLKRNVATFRVDEEMHQQMIVLRERDGTPFAVQTRRALERFLEEKGVRPKARRRLDEPDDRR
jgi:hypothetical protein